MKPSSLITLAGILAFTCAPFALAQDAKPDKPQRMKPNRMKMGKMGSYDKLIAVIQPVGDSHVSGTVMFEKVAEGVKVTAKVGGLEPNQKHGIHIHEFGDIASDDATSAGGHFNPEGNPHALPDKAKRHAGDLGNLDVDGDGNGTLTLTVDNITLDCGPHGILGRAMILHAKPDDGGQPTGNAGARVGAGVIGIANGATRSMPGRKNMPMGIEKEKP